MPVIPAEKKTQIAAAYNFSPILALVDGTLSAYPATANPTTNTITAVGHDFVNGTPVRFSNVGGGLPGGLTMQQYYVVNAGTDTFQVSTSVGGSSVDITSAGSGTHTVTESAIEDLVINYTDASIVWDVMVRHEVNYQGSGRQSFTWGSPLQNMTTGQVSIPLIAINVIPTTGSIKFRYVVILRGANTTPGSGVGSVSSIEDVGETTINRQGQIFTFNPVYV